MGLVLYSSALILAEESRATKKFADVVFSVGRRIPYNSFVTEV